MPVPSLIDESNDLAIRRLSGEDPGFILRAALVATDHGMLVTGLNLDIIAVNRRFGEIFGVTPGQALELGMEPLRAHLRPFIVDADRWMAVTNSIYEAPERIYEDIIEIQRERRTVLRRYSAPVQDSTGKIIARLWTYRDITREKRLEEMHEEMQKIGESLDPDPEVVIRNILSVINRRYGNTTAILSIRKGEMMIFRTVVGPNPLINALPGNAVSDSYCQFALSADRAIIIQDSLKSDVHCAIKAAQFGLTRYLGVPIVDDIDGTVGTLCLIDEKSDQPLDDLDIHFFTLLGVRVASELARERFVKERLAAKEQRIQAQIADLANTNAVFNCMNASFGLLSRELSTDAILEAQTRLLTGILDYPITAILIRRNQENRFHGLVTTSRSRRISTIDLESNLIDGVTPDAINFSNDTNSCLATRLKCPFTSYAVRHEAEVGDVLIAFGRHEAPPTDERHRLYLEALADQVCLVLSTHVLQSDLVNTNRKLADAQDQLLRKEKLSVVGTLAASTAHDIRNITASLGLLAAPSNLPAEETLTAIREQLGRFDVLAHRLLSYAKPRLVAQESVKIHAVLESVLALTAAQARVSHVVVKRKIRPDLPAVTGDPHQFEHLFINLILNAIQSMDRGGVITVSAESDGQHLRVKFIDEGPGLSPDMKLRLFEPFSSSRSDGFGLGLFSCKRIVEAHGGAISARRNPKVGSTFTVQIPVQV